MKRAVLVLLCAAAGACRGGLDDSASVGCQQQFEHHRPSPEQYARACDLCCGQDIVHHGRIERGLCACYP